MSLQLPVIYLLSTNLSPPELRKLHDEIPTLTHDVNKAEIVLGKVTHKQRAQFELRRLKIKTEPLEWTAQSGDDEARKSSVGKARDAKRRKLDGQEAKISQGTQEACDGVVRVVNLSWLTESMERGLMLPTSSYVVYAGRKVSQGEVAIKAAASGRVPVVATPSLTVQHAANKEPNRSTRSTHQHNSQKNVQQQTIQALPPSGRNNDKLGLLRQTTSEDDDRLLPIPDFLLSAYSCQRPTPMKPPNITLIEQLKQIRLLRLLRGDEIGARAYSTSISSLAAYPYRIKSVTEIVRLPGCGAKIAELYREWQATGHIKELRDSEADPEISILKLFYNIWGVGDAHAREFYKRGWRELDDIVEYGWQNLSRVQQIGVKFYVDFQQSIGREEIAKIGSIILSHAHQLDRGYKMAIVGGYRRGKEECSDIDVIISHPDEQKTLNLIERLVLCLEGPEYVTHTLSLSTKNSDRGQTPLPWKGEGGISTSWGAGFDTLDKAMVVWRDPKQPGALHRRVDVVVSPWKTVGCAMLGWSGETTFERDLRRYCKEELNLKFDSSGIRDRADGSWVDLETVSGHPADDMEEAERRVFDGLKIPWLPPFERCTG